VPKVTFVNEKKTVEVERGASLRYAALENGIPLYCMWFGVSKFANCHGNGLCWTDRVRVTPASAVTETTVLEKAMHQFGSFPPVIKKGDPRDRLACQLIVLDDCEVTTRCRTRR
jgi:ferredoxin